MRAISSAIWTAKIDFPRLESAKRQHNFSFVPEFKVELGWVWACGSIGDGLVGCLDGEYADFDGLLRREGVADFGCKLLYYCFVHFCRVFCWSHSMIRSICSSVRSSGLIFLRLMSSAWMNGHWRSVLPIGSLRFAAI